MQTGSGRLFLQPGTLWAGGVWVFKPFKASRVGNSVTSQRAANHNTLSGRRFPKTPDSGLFIRWKRESEDLDNSDSLRGVLGNLKRITWYHLYLCWWFPPVNALMSFLHTKHRGRHTHMRTCNKMNRTTTVFRKQGVRQPGSDLIGSNNHLLTKEQLMCFFH